MVTSVLTPLQLIAGASLLQNQGIGVSTELTAAISSYTSTAVMQAFLSAAAQDSSLDTLAANSVPAFSNSLPSAYSALGTQMTDVINAQAVQDSGNGDVSKFVQAFNLASSYGRITNQFINSAINSQTYLANTFTSTNDMITGDITTVNLATPVFGQDLQNLGRLINLAELNGLGSPLVLIQNIVQATGNIPVLNLLLLAEGVPEEIILNLTDPTLTVSGAIQKLMYQAMGKITGSDLAQILLVLDVTTQNLNYMSDLLDPVKLFPNSFMSLTVQTQNGVRAIYINSSGSTNPDLLLALPEYIRTQVEFLQQIIPPDQALANQALAVALSQINGISATSLPTFSITVEAMQTTKDLPLITALTTAVPESVADYYTSQLAVGNGPNGTIRVVDIIGLAGGWVATDAFIQTVAIFDTMNLADLTTIYQQMDTALSGGYGPTDSGPIVIPSGPAAGSYSGTEIDPGPPPVYDPTAIEEAMSALTSAAQAEIANLQAIYPDQCSELNDLWTAMAQQVVKEDTLQPIASLDFAQLQANNRNSIYGFIFGLTNYGLQTEEGGLAWFLESMADLTTLGGQAIIACLREGRNASALSASAIFTNTRIPADPIPPPPEAVLLPSEYSETEAQNLVVK